MGTQSDNQVNNLPKVPPLVDPQEITPKIEEPLRAKRFPNDVEKIDPSLEDDSED